MEGLKNEIGEAGLPVPTTNQEATALDIIRTETVLSRLPIHNLAKKGKVNIQILKTTPDGKVELKGPKNTVVTNISAIKLVDGWVAVSVN